MYNQEYLQRLINNRIEESIILDYKAADALHRSKTKDISKDASAFANSAGGIIIYGIIEDKVDEHIPSRIDAIDRKAISKEWLEQVILSNIQPRIEGVLIHPIEIDGDLNKVVYVVEIPQSSTAHQANDHRYYKRFNFMSVPMQDFEIRDTFNRAKHPIIELEFEVNIYGHHGTITLDVYAVNKGTVYVNYINCILKIPTDYYGEDIDFNPKYIEIPKDNLVKDYLGYHPEARLAYSQPRFNPLLPGRRMKLETNKITLNKKFDKATIQWTVYADNAAPKSGSTDFKDIEVYYPPY